MEVGPKADAPKGCDKYSEAQDSDSDLYSAGEEPVLACFRQGQVGSPPAARPVAAALRLAPP
jgi:hypothetical protein